MSLRYQKGNEYFGQMREFKKTDQYQVMAKKKSQEKRQLKLEDEMRKSAYKNRDKSVDWLAKKRNEKNYSSLGYDEQDLKDRFETPLKIGRAVDIAKYLTDRKAMAGVRRKGSDGLGDKLREAGFVIEKFHELDGFALINEKRVRAEACSANGSPLVRLGKNQDMLDDYYLKAIKAKLSFLDED